MKKNKILYIVFLLTIFSCKDDVSTPYDSLEDGVYTYPTPCDSLEGGVYTYPVIEDTRYNQQEVDSIYSIPDSILNCITTKGLVETCMSHPFFIAYVLAGSTPYGSYQLVKYKINAIEELESREDAASVMFDKYLYMSPEVDTSNVDMSLFYFYSYELLFSQKLFLDEFNLDDRVLLTTECLEKFDVKKNLYGEHTLVVDGTSIIISTLMLIDEYPIHSRFYNPFFTNPDSVLFYADDYLNFIKNKSNED